MCANASLRSSGHRPPPDPTITLRSEAVWAMAVLFSTLTCWTHFGASFQRRSRSTVLVVVVVVIKAPKRSDPAPLLQTPATSAQNNMGRSLNLCPLANKEYHQGSVGPWPLCSEQIHQVPSQDSGTPSPGPFATTIELRQNQSTRLGWPVVPDQLSRCARTRGERRPKRSRSHRCARIGEPPNRHLS
ncbi:hypothetical protein VTN02DRAFT_5316 [Thermoascus thermophilus]